MRPLLAIALLALGGSTLLCGGAVLSGCATTGAGPVRAAPLLDEGELHVYLAPFPHESHRLTFAIRDLAAVTEGGQAVSLPLGLTTLAGASQVRDQRILVSGRLPHGRYVGLRFTAASGKLTGDEEPVDLLVEKDPARIDVPFELQAGRAVVLVLTFDMAASVRGGFEFTPRFHGLVASRTSPGLVAACSSAAGNGVALFDSLSKAVTGLVATGQGPQGLALDPIGNRGYAALSGQDQVETFDLARGERLQRFNVGAGDAPRELLLLPDRRTLLVINEASRSAAFLDTSTGQELARVAVGEGPCAVTGLRSGNRAVVVNRRSASMTLVDLATKQAIGTVPTDPEPLQAQVSRDGNRLYVIQAGSLSMAEYALPGLTVTKRIRVGLGASTLKLDARSDLLYLAHAGDSHVEVYDAVLGLPVDGFDLPAWPSQFAIDDLQDQLFAVMPSRRSVAVVDLVNRRLVAELALPSEPFELRLAAERN
jgi:DNA-binding beta-propeller fold protein YncE